MRSQSKQAMQLVLQDPNGASAPQVVPPLNGMQRRHNLRGGMQRRHTAEADPNGAMTGSAASAPQLRRHSSGCSPQDQLVIAATFISRDRKRSEGEHLPQENISPGSCATSRRPSRALSIGSGSSRGDGSARRPSSSNEVSPCGTSRGSPAPCRGGVGSGSPSHARRMSNPNTGKSEDGSEAGGAANISLRTFGRTDTCAEQIAASAVKNELNNNNLRASFVEASPESGEGPESSP